MDVAASSVRLFIKSGEAGFGPQSHFAYSDLLEERTWAQKSHSGLGPWLCYFLAV